MEKEAAQLAPEANPVVAQWLQDRAELSKLTGQQETRLSASEMYTDDKIGAVLGVERVVRYLTAWYEITRSITWSFSQ